jgi:hypothetical protein
MSSSPRRLQKTLRKALKRPVELVFSCDEPWEDMEIIGERVRRCARCDSSVHDLSDKTPAEVRAYVRAHGGALCGQVSIRPDGRVVDGDCVSGLLVRGGLVSRSNVS